MKPVEEEQAAAPSSTVLSPSQHPGRFQRLCEVLPLAVLETDVDENLLYANPRWEEISGYCPEFSKGQGWRDAIHCEDQEWVLEEATLARGQNRMFDADFRLSHPDAGERWVHGRSLPLYSRDEWHDGYLHMIYDVSDRKLIEGKLRDSLVELTSERAQELAEMSAAAEQVKGSLGEARELADSLRASDSPDVFAELVDRLRKSLENAVSAAESLPAVEAEEVEDPSLADILF